MDDAAMECGECFAERQVVLVDEEPGNHRLLRRQRAELFLVGHGGLDRDDIEVVAVGDRVERLTGVIEISWPERITMATERQSDR